MTDPNAHINYSFSDIERYLNGGMTAKEMHDLERAALQDPFLADAIEGYENANSNIANRHLNEIAVALQKAKPAKVITMPEKKRYGWLVAASLLAVIGTGVFLFTSQNKSAEPLATNIKKRSAQEDSFTESNKMTAPKTDSQSSSGSGDLALLKPETKEKNRVFRRKKSSPVQEPITESAPQDDNAPQVAMNSAAPSLKDNTAARQKQLITDSSNTSTSMSSSAEVTPNTSAKRQGKTTNTWTTDKGKPFLLSEVEIINIGNKTRKKATDTSAVKPQGGWQSFQNYLFSRLNRHDSLSLINNNAMSGNLEVEFSVDNSGLPYDITVLNTQDSTLSNKIIQAVQSGPKWTSPDSKEKRLRLRY